MTFPLDSRSNILLEAPAPRIAMPSFSVKCPFLANVHAPHASTPAPARIDTVLISAGWLSREFSRNPLLYTLRMTTFPPGSSFSSPGLIVSSTCCLSSTSRPSSIVNVPATINDSIYISSLILTISSSCFSISSSRFSMLPQSSI